MSETHAQTLFAISNTKDPFRNTLYETFAKVSKETFAALPRAMVIDIPGTAKRIAVTEGAISVYTQALRDVLDLFDSRADNAESADSGEFRADLRACLTVMQFARELGIDLEATP